MSYFSWLGQIAEMNVAGEAVGGVHVSKVKKYTFKVQNNCFQVKKYIFKIEMCALEAYKVYLESISNYKKQQVFFKVQKHHFNGYKYTFILKYSSILSNYKRTLSKFKSMVSKYNSKDPTTAYSNCPPGYMHPSKKAIGFSAETYQWTRIFSVVLCENQEQLGFALFDQVR